MVSRSGQRMKRALLTLGATALAVYATLLFRGYTLHEYAGKGAVRGTFYSPWAMLEAGFVFLTTLCLFAAVARFARSSWFVLCAAALYCISITWPGRVWHRHPESIVDAPKIYPAVYLSEIAAAIALIAVLVYSWSRKAAR
jgi:hypothetical protein